MEDLQIYRTYVVAAKEACGLTPSSSLTTNLNREDVDIFKMLVLAATAYSDNDYEHFKEHLSNVFHHSLSLTTPEKRLVACVSDALSDYARAHKPEWAELPPSPFTKARESNHADIKIKYLADAKCAFSALSPVLSFSEITTKIALSHAFEDKTAVHILDFDFFDGWQWDDFLQYMCCRPQGKPQVLRITGLVAENQREMAEAAQVRLTSLAQRYELHFNIALVFENSVELKPEDLGVTDGECYAVYWAYHSLYDDRFFNDGQCGNIKKFQLLERLSPKIVTISEPHINTEGSFLERFNAVLMYYSILLDSLHHHKNLTSNDSNNGSLGLFIYLVEVQIIWREIRHALIIGGRNISSSLMVSSRRFIKSPMTEEAFTQFKFYLGGGQFSHDGYYILKTDMIEDEKATKDKVSEDEDRKYGTIALVWRDHMLCNVSTWIPVLTPKLVVESLVQRQIFGGSRHLRYEKEQLLRLKKHDRETVLDRL